MTNAKLLLAIAFALAVVLVGFVIWSSAHAARPAEPAHARGLAASSESPILASAALAPEPAVESEPASPAEPALAAPASTSRQLVAADEPGDVVRLRGRVVDRDGNPQSGVRPVARCFEATEAPRDRKGKPIGHREWHAGILYRHAVPGAVATEELATAADGRFTITVRSASLQSFGRCGVRLALAGEEALGGPAFVLVRPGTSSLGSCVEVSPDGVVEFGDVVLSAQARLVCAGRFLRGDESALRASAVRSELALDGQACELRPSDGDPDTNGCRIVQNEGGEFAIYADRPLGWNFALTCEAPGLAPPEPIEAPVGRRDLRVYFHEWAVLRGSLRFASDALPGKVTVRCAELGLAASQPVETRPKGTSLGAEFSFPQLRAGRHVLSLVSYHHATSASELGAFELGVCELEWGERRELLPFDVQGLFRATRLVFHSAAGLPASGWAITDLPGATPIGFSQSFEAALPTQAARLHVYVPGHRIATVELPARSAAIELAPGPLLDLGLGAVEAAQAQWFGYDIELAPLELADPLAARFASVMQLLPLPNGARTSLRLPSAGTYRLRYAVQRPSQPEPPRSVDIAVSDAGRRWDP
jgi:hypothetical protein